MAPGIKVCQTCGGLYTGSTERCLDCIVHAMPPPAHIPALTRAQRRAAEQERRARDLAASRAKINRERRYSPTAKAPAAAQQSKVGKAPPPTASGPSKLPQRAMPKYVNTNPPGIVQKRGTVWMPSPSPSLGALTRTEGEIRTVVGPGGRMIKKVTIQCSCRGENSNCFKCDGTGYCEAEIVSEPSRPAPIDQVRSRNQNASQPETHFTGDGRGGETYGIRERGRFGSNPLRDDHDE